jgi:hypothetical protein
MGITCQKFGDNKERLPVCKQGYSAQEITNRPPTSKLINVPRPIPQNRAEPYEKASTH